VGYVVIKISKPFWRTRILSIDVHPAKTRKRNYWCFYKDVAPLVLWKGQIYVTMFSMWLKTSWSSAMKINLNRFGEHFTYRLMSFRPKYINETAPVFTKMLHLWGFGRYKSMRLCFLGSIKNSLGKLG
jgi:hypothetical protein